jgi:hypothetical protein
MSIKQNYHPDTEILVKGLRDLPGGQAVLDAWDKARSITDSKPALTFQQRVVAEKRELDGRLIALNRFIDPANPTYAALPLAEKALLRHQSRVMFELSEILEVRIAFFE